MCGHSGLSTPDANLRALPASVTSPSCTASTAAPVPFTPSAPSKLCSVAAALKRRLPPAEIIQLDAGYLVVRRRHAAARDTCAQHSSVAGRQQDYAPKQARRLSAEPNRTLFVAGLRVPG